MNTINRSSTNELYVLANKMGLIDLIIIRKKDLKKYFNGHENLILNLDDKSSGTHWVAINTKKKIYFDSYNLPPPNIIPKDFKQANSRFQIQSLNSQMCGQLCVLFLYYLQKNKNPDKGIKEFYNNFNDVYPF